MFWSIFGLIVYFIVCIIVFLVCRELICWYWKINARLQALENICQNLEENGRKLHENGRIIFKNYRLLEKISDRLDGKIPSSNENIEEPEVNEKN